MRFASRCLFLLLVSTATLLAADAPGMTALPFTAEHWDLQAARVEQLAGREALEGFAALENLQLADGVIELDLFVTGERSYPGVVFRLQERGESERIYVRPHVLGLYPNALQYTPVFHGIAGWQLYSGPGYTAAAAMPLEEWVTLRLEMKGTQARVFLGDLERPALVIPRLERGAAAGGIALMGPADGSAYFSNVRYAAGDDLAFDPPPHHDLPPGTITSWTISESFPLSRLDDFQAALPEEFASTLSWIDATVDERGLVDVARWYGRTSGEPDAIVARTTIHADEARTLHLALGYSDVVVVHLDGEPLYTGNNAYRARDPMFQGIVGPFEALHLPLKKGDNELTLLLVEAFGGWGFMARDMDAVYTAPGVMQVFESPRVAATAESVLYDRENHQLLVTGYDAYRREDARGGQVIAALTCDGQISESAWLRGLRQPTGMIKSEGVLHVVERTGLARVDASSGEILERIDLPARFPNDVALDGAGTLYVSDSAGPGVLRVRDGEVETWVSGPPLVGANALLVFGDELLVGNADGCVRAVHLESGELRTFVCLPPGTIDGLKPDGEGNVLVMEWEGRLYRVTPAGQATLLLDASGPGRHFCDFDYVPEEHLLLVPTFTDDTVIGYRLSE